MNPEEQEYIRGLQNRLQTSETNRNEVANAASSMFLANQDGNLIEYQLEMDNILERIDHLLRGHELKFDDKGNANWVEPKDKTSCIFNEYGVQEILRILSMYLNRNTILSNYKDETINEKVYDLGIDISDLIFMKYEDMFDFPSYKECRKLYLQQLEKSGLRSSYKKRLDYKKLIRRGAEDLRKDLMMRKIKLYLIIVREIVDTVHSAYLRALHGGERESLRSARMVSQSISPQGMAPQIPNQSKFSMWRPSTWGKN